MTSGAVTHATALAKARSPALAAAGSAQRCQKSFAVSDSRAASTVRSTSRGPNPLCPATIRNRCVSPGLA